MEYTTALDIGERKREQGGINEDSVAVTLLEEGHRDTERRSGVFVVADGAGGAQAGDVASYVASVEVSRRLTDRLWTERRLGEVTATGDAEGPGNASAGSTGAGEEGRSGSTGLPELTEGVVGDPFAGADDAAVQAVIAAAVEAAHTRIVEVIGERDLDSAYSTVVVALVVGDRLHYGWVGDSRAYVVNLAPDRDEAQRVTRLTADHSEVEQLVDRGAIDEVEAHVHRRGNRITRALGGTRTENPATATVEVDTASVPLFGDDVLLLTSDGLIDAYTGAPELHREYEDADDTAEVAERILEKSVTDDEIGRVVREASSLSAAADRFVDLSNERGGKDNLSLVLARDPDLPAAPEGTLPVRTYDPDPETVIEWDTVKQFPEDDPEGAGADPEGETGAGTRPGGEAGTTEIPADATGRGVEGDSSVETGADGES